MFQDNVYTLKFLVVTQKLPKSALNDRSPSQEAKTEVVEN